MAPEWAPAVPGPSSSQPWLARHVKTRRPMSVEPRERSAGEPPAPRAPDADFAIEGRVVRASLNRVETPSPIAR